MITDIRLKQFRSYSDDSFELEPGVNIIVGPNASGKTNLLEAILIAALGSSYRAKDIELVQFEKPWARLEVHTALNDSRTVKLELEGERLKKQFIINGQSFERLSLQRTLPVVVFEPSDLQMLNGAPELRRQYLDNLLEQIQPGYSSLRRQFKRALAQRNALLKRGRALSEPQLFAWNIRLSELGSQIAEARTKLVEGMNNQVNKLYDQLSRTKSKIVFKYHSNISAGNYATNLLHKLESSEQIDYERGFTTHGPHRDDLHIFLNGHLAQEMASRGEMRTLLLVCKMLETELLKKNREHPPILLLDDVFSELDGSRRQALTSFLQPYQTFITTTDADVVIQHFTESTNVIPLSKKRR